MNNTQPFPHHTHQPPPSHIQVHSPLILKNRPLNQPNNFPVRQISRSPIISQQNLTRTQPSNLPVRGLQPEPPQNKKIDINLNIRVNNDQSITVSSNNQQLNHPPLKMHSPPPFRPQPMIIPQRLPMPQRPPPVKPQQSHISSSTSKIKESKISYSSFEPKMQEYKIYCVICQEQYSEFDKFQHIKKHQKPVPQKRNYDVSSLIKKYEVVEEPAQRPIVQPEQYIVEYHQPPSNHQSRANYQEDRVIETKVENYEEPQFILPTDESKKIRLTGEEAQTMVINDYSQHRMTRKEKAGSQFYPTSPIKTVSERDEVNISPEKERISLEDRQEEQIQHYNRQQSIKKRIYNAQDYGSNEKPREEERFTYIPPENKQTETVSYQPNETYHTRVSGVQQNYHQSYNPAKISQIKEEQAEYLDNSENFQNRIPRQSYQSSEMRSSQPLVMEPPQIPIETIIKSSGGQYSVQDSSQAYSYELDAFGKKKKLTKDSARW